MLRVGYCWGCKWHYVRLIYNIHAIERNCLRRGERETYRVFEPWDSHHPHHDADDDGPEAEEGELRGSVALVPAAVGGVHVARRHRTGSGETVLPDDSEGQRNMKLNITLWPPPPAAPPTLVTGSSGRSGHQWCSSCASPPPSACRSHSEAVWFLSGQSQCLYLKNFAATSCAKCKHSCKTIFFFRWLHKETLASLLLNLVQNSTSWKA